MARMNRPAPVEITYKNMRFLITHNPTNATLNKFIEVSLSHKPLTVFLNETFVLVGIVIVRMKTPETWNLLVWNATIFYFNLTLTEINPTGAEEIWSDHRGEGLWGHIRLHPGGEGRNPSSGEFWASNLRRLHDSWPSNPSQWRFYPSVMSVCTQPFLLLCFYSFFPRVWKPSSFQLVDSFL